jgi:hypothetical protein
VSKTKTTSEPGRISEMLHPLTEIRLKQNQVSARRYSLLAIAVSIGTRSRKTIDASWTARETPGASTSAGRRAQETRLGVGHPRPPRGASLARLRTKRWTRQQRLGLTGERCVCVESPMSVGPLQLGSGAELPSVHKRTGNALCPAVLLRAGRRCSGRCTWSSCYSL